jgi:hypothetical protein
MACTLVAIENFWFTTRVNAPQRYECAEHNQFDMRANGSLVRLVLQIVPYIARPTTTRLPPASQFIPGARRLHEALLYA